MRQGESRRWLGRLRGVPRLVLLAGLAALAACSSDRGGPVVHRPAPQLSETIVTDDALAQWAPYIHEASRRYGVPEPWIREVMMQESAGQQYVDGQPITSPAGAMGLMQVMPGTYDILRRRYGLGSDPYDPHDNIMAGTAYIREMYDRYGSPGFLAAYNAGPGRLEQYLAGESALPSETVNYVAAVAPRLGNAAPATGPLAGYTMMASTDMGGGHDPRMMRQATRELAQVAGRPAPAGCDPLAAYDPNGPCGAAELVATGVAVATLPPPPSAPAAAAEPAPMLVAVAAPAPAPVVVSKPAPPLTLIALAPPVPAPAPPPSAKPASAKPASAKPGSPSRLDQAVAFLSAPSGAQPVAMGTAAPAPARVQLAAVPRAELAPVGRSAIQVGSTFDDLGAARAAAAKARLVGQSVLSGAQVQVARTTPFGGKVYYMARLAGLTPGAAVDACQTLARQSIKCQVVTATQAS